MDARGNTSSRPTPLLFGDTSSSPHISVCTRELFFVAGWSIKELCIGYRVKWRGCP